MVTSGKNLSSWRGLLTICRNALNRFKRNRGIEDVPGVIDQELMRHDLKDLRNTPGENQQLAITNHGLLASKSEGQRRDDGVFVAAPTRVRSARLKGSASVPDEASQEFNGGALVHGDFPETPSGSTVGPRGAIRTAARHREEQQPGGSPRPSRAAIVASSICTAGGFPGVSCLHCRL